MDLVTVDITHLKEEPKKLTFIGLNKQLMIYLILQILCHEILINLGNRYSKISKLTYEQQ